LKTLIEKLLTQALAALPEDLVPPAARSLGVEVENTRDAQHGDFASNLAMRLAKATRQNPRKLAEALVRMLPQSPALAKVEIAGAGFINFFLSNDAYHAEIGKVLREGRQYGRSSAARGRSAQVEFVSANPTGPLHVGHGRHAAFGATVANLLEAVGYRVEREYYINDAGRQMEILAVSTWLRYLEQCGERFAFPANGYRGDYIAVIGEQLFAAEGVKLRHSAAEIFKDLPPDEPQGGDKDAHIDALIARARLLIGDTAFRRVLDLALAEILGDIREDLREFGVTFDYWFSERTLSDDGSVERALLTRDRAIRLRCKASAMVMTHGNGACIGDIVGPGHASHPEQVRHHPGHLGLACRAVAAHRFLHLGRCVLDNHHAFSSQRAEDHAARFADAHRGAAVGREEELLNRSDLWTERGAGVDHEVEEGCEPCRFARLRNGLDA